MNKRLKRLIICFAICCIGEFSGYLRASEGASPQAEKRSFIVEVDGYAYFSEEKTGKQLRIEAEMDAKRKAVESASVYVKSQTKVENFELKYDIIQTQSEAGVKILQQKDIGLEDGKRYHVWMKAEVSYALEKKIRADEATPVGEGLLLLKVWTDKDAYEEGEKIKVFIRGNNDFYLNLVYREVDNSYIQLLPNAYRKDNHFKGGVTYAIPDANDRFSFKITPPFGSEKIMIYASTAKMKMAAEDKPAVRGGFYSLKKIDSRAIGDGMRGMVVIGENDKAADFYEAVLEVKTKPKPKN